MAAERLMVRYALQRLFLVIPTVLGMTVLIFAMVRLLPGDVVVAMSGGDAAVSDVAHARVRQALGLSDPLPVQYLRYVSGLVTGDMGTSFSERPTGRPDPRPEPSPSPSS